jgi:hypothetical protein
MQSVLWEAKAAMDSIDLQLAAVNHKLRACGQPEIGKVQLLIIMGMEKLNVEAMDRINENWEHIIAGLKGIENDE